MPFDQLDLEKVGPRATEQVAQIKRKDVACKNVKINLQYLLD
jgi:hypothetical protein